jgi:two-component system, sporulation sensor kinase E
MDAMLQLASGVAHEVRNPLSTISGSVQYLNSIMEREENPVQEHLGVVSESCELIESIINELMNFARPRPMTFGQSDINACLRRTISLLGGRCRRRQIEIRLELDPHLPSIVCDEEHLGQVFINLTVNAIQAMPQGGTLTIHTRNEPLHQRALILFQDTGCGIKPDEIERVFEPFFSKRSKGIGLGLTVTRRIIEDHFGRIWIESDEGKGTSIYMQVPYRMQPKGRE